MRDSDLHAIEAALNITLPPPFRQFMIDHGQSLADAAKLLRDEVVLFADAPSVISLNQSLRKQGFYIEDDLTRWPAEYLALSDNGAGDHLCIKLDEGGLIYAFDHESGSFSRNGTSLKRYLADLGKRVHRYKQSDMSKSDPRLTDALVIVGNSKSIDIVVRDIPPPVTPEKLRDGGTDVNHLMAAVATLLQTITGIDAHRWNLSIGEGEYPARIGIRFTTDQPSARPRSLTNLQFMSSKLQVGLKVDPRDRGLRADQLQIKWKAVESAMTTLLSVIAKESVSLTLGAMSAGFSGIGYGTCTCTCILTPQAG